MRDFLVERLTVVPEHERMAPLPFPAGLAPSPGQHPPAASSDPLPEAEVMVITYTTAEAEALADVLTPGVPRTQWQPYTENWSAYESQLTGRSPAHEEKCIAHYWSTEIGGVNVMVGKSELHLAVDGDSVPVRQMWKQMLAEVKPKLVITTGTAGGIGTETVLGDVLVTSAAKFNCTARFKAEPWAQERYVGPAVPQFNQNSWAQLSGINAGQLRPVATRNPVLIMGADVETVDYFAFADATDSYGVVKDDPVARCEEMDDAVLPLALADIGSDTPWLAIRNASDPQVPHMATLEDEKKWAADIYQKYGYWTTVGSALACWAVIAENRFSS